MPPRCATLSAMLIRALCLSLVLLAGPVSPWVTAPCCDAVEACCADEQPTCPVQPDGECAIESAGPTPAAVSPAVDQISLLPSGAPSYAMVAGSVRAVPGSFHDSSPPRYLVFQSLRN